LQSNRHGGRRDGAFKKAYPQAAIRNVKHETEDGQEQYEIESVDHGLGLDVNYKPDGTVIVIEEEVTAADVPAAVMAAITARYPKATVTRCERAIEQDEVLRTPLEGCTGEGSPADARGQMDFPQAQQVARRIRLRRTVLHSAVPGVALPGIAYLTHRSPSSLSGLFEAKFPGHGVVLPKMS
jgi:hypothetical protein